MSNKNKAHIELNAGQEYLVKYKGEYEIALFTTILVRASRVSLKFLHVETGQDFYLDIDFDGDIREWK